MSSCASCTEHQAADTGFLARLVLVVAFAVVFAAGRFELDLLRAWPLELFDEVTFAVGVALEADLGTVCLVAVS